MWQALRPGDYPYRLTPDVLVRALMTAFVLRLSGLRDIVARCGRVLGTQNFSSLSPALSRPCALAFVQALIERLEARHRPARDVLVIIDGMPLTLPATRRHRCARWNRRTVGGGVIWACMVQAARGVCPVRVLKVVAGAWKDAAQMRTVQLTPDAPVYVMDRGFYALALLRDWGRQGVRFIVRAPRNIVFEPLATLSAPRRWGTDGRIELDAWVRLGCDKAPAHPEARLIRAVVGKLVLQLVTSERTWSAERVLEAYRQRGRIEQFHRVLKDVIGLAHLYNFSQSGLMLLLHTALLLALLLVIDEPAGASAPRAPGPDGEGVNDAEEVVALLSRRVRQLRTSLGLGHTWKRNINAIKRKKHRPNC